MCAVIIFLIVLIYLISLLGKAGIILAVLAIPFIIICIVEHRQNMKERAAIIRSTHETILKSCNSEFIPTKNVYREFSHFAVYIDEANRKIMIANLLNKAKNVFSFDDIVECSILQDGATLMADGTDRAIIGGILGGSTGAIVGAASRESKPIVLTLLVRIIITDIQCPLQEIPIITTQMERTSTDYTKRIQFAQEIYATIISAMNQKQTQE